MCIFQITDTCRIYFIDHEMRTFMFKKIDFVDATSITLITFDEIETQNLVYVWGDVEGEICSRHI